MSWYNTALSGGGSGGSSDVMLCPFTMIPDTYIERDGSQVSYGGWSSTSFIYLNETNKFFVSGNIKKANWNAYYDSNKNFISFFGSVSSVMTAPANAKYVRLSGGTWNITGGGNSVMSYKG